MNDPLMQRQQEYKLPAAAAAAATASATAAPAGEASVTLPAAASAVEPSGIDSVPDLFRETPVRFLGYANEIGESLRPVTPSIFVKATYGVSFAYVLADTIDKSYQLIKQMRIYNRGASSIVADMQTSSSSASRAAAEKVGSISSHIKNGQISPTLRTILIGETAADTLIWQTFASVLVPGFTINRVVAASKWLLEKSIPAKHKYKVGLGKFAIKWLPTLIGLGTIPVIIHPIDSLVHQVMDRTTRPFAVKLRRKWLEHSSDDK